MGRHCGLLSVPDNGDMSTNANGVSTYQKKRARAYQDKFAIPYIHALRLVREEMAADSFDPRQPIPDELPR